MVSLPDNQLKELCRAGYLRADSEFFTGKKRGSTTTPGGSGTPAGPQPSIDNPAGVNAYPDDVEVFPFPVTD